MREGFEMRKIIVGLFHFSVLCTGPLAAEEPRLPRMPTTGILLPAVTRPERTSFPMDAVEAQRLLGTGHVPKEGDEVRGAAGSARRWTRIEADANGVFRHRNLRGGFGSIVCRCSNPSGTGEADRQRSINHGR